MMAEKDQIKIFSEIFPYDLFKVVSEKINISQLNEIRLRINKPIVVSMGGQNYFLGKEGITNNIKSAIIFTKEDIENIIFRASQCSIYAVNEQIKQGFLTLENGVRIGIAGKVVYENSEIKTIKDFTSLVIRIPHNIRNCSLIAFNNILNNGNFCNTLIISPPGCGKTTFLRDILFQLSSRNICFNVLVLDERGEIAGTSNNDNCLIDSNFCDVLSFSSKKDGFLFGIRALSPSLIFCDEIGGKEDFEAINYACNCGVGIVSTIHAASLDELKRKPNFMILKENKLFERYVLLSNREGPGTLEGIYDENFNLIKNF